MAANASPSTRPTPRMMLSRGGALLGSGEHTRGWAFTATAAMLAFTLILSGSPWSAGVAYAAQNPRINLRVLVIAPASDPSTDAIATQLDREGVPYDKVVVGAADRPVIDAAFLADAATNTAKYQAVVVKDNAGGGIAPGEMAALIAYERQYGIRQVDAYNYPNPAVGLAPPSYTGPLDGATATVTAAGLSGPFSYLNGSLPIDNYNPGVDEVPGYLASPNPALAVGETFTPLIEATVNGATGVLVGVDTRDGREEMTISAGYNSSQLWWNEIASGVVTWMTRGIHLGYQRNWFNVQIDDVLIPDARWSVTGNCTPGDECVDPAVTTTDVRMTADDVGELVAWQNANNFKMDIAFNAGGTGVWYQSLNPTSPLTPAQMNDQPDPLRDAFLASKNEFNWINHTWTHIFLGCIQLARTATQPWSCATDPITGTRQDPTIESTLSGTTYWAAQAAITEQIQWNIDWAATNSLPNFDPAELITGEHSGLRVLPQQPDDNPFFGPTLDAAGVKFVASDNSREPAPRAVQGSTSAVTVPRYPMNIFYNVGTYQEEVDEYNWIYVSRADPTEPGSGVCDDNTGTSTCISPLPSATPAEAKASFDNYIMPLEIRNALSKVTAGDPRPFYAHQSNLAEDGILYPVVQGILDQYRAVYNSSAPVVQSDLTEQSTQLQRMAGWRGISQSTTAYLDATGVNVPDGTADIPLTMPKGSITTGASLAEYAGELSAWTSGAVTSVPPTPMGGYAPAPGVTTPDTPGSVTATAGDASATVSWTAPVSDGGAPLNAYVVTVIPGSGASYELFPAPTATSLVVTGLTNGTPYTFTVQAQNDRFLRSAPSAPTPSVTPGENLPTAPANVTATSGDRSATVSWTASASTGDAPLNAYIVTLTPDIGTAIELFVLPDANGQLATSTVATGLTNGTPYTVTVVAQNALFKRSVPSAPPASVTPSAAVPSAPTGVTATPGNASATVTWAAPASDGGAPISGFVVNAYAAGSQTAAAVVDVPSWNATNVLVQGLTNGTAYTFTVAAKNSIGTGAASEPSNAVTPVTTPGAPTITNVTSGDASAAVTWTAPTDTGGSPLTGWEVQAIPAGSVTPVGTVTIDEATLSATVTGLVNGTSYTLTVAAKNAQGVGTADSFTPVIPAAPIVVPGAPTITATTASDTQVTVTWAPPSDGTAPSITGYTVNAYEGDGTAVVATVAATAADGSAVVAGLTNGTAYTFTVTALNGDVAGTPSARSQATTPTAPVTVPGAPGIGTATAGDGSATVTWTAPASDGGSAITAYTVIAYDGATAAKTVEASAGATSAEIPGLTNGTAYTFTVTAVNAQGPGTPSAPTAAVTPAAPTPPGAPTIASVAGGDASVTLVWDAPIDTGTAPGGVAGLPITGYTVQVFEGDGTTPVNTIRTDGTTLTATILGLTNGRVYTFTVTAENSVGPGPESARSPSVTPAGKPGAPTIGTAVAGAGSATVSWTAPSTTGGSALTEYEVAVFAGGTLTKTVTVPAAASSVVVTGLTNGTEYTFTVAAINGVGTGLASAPTNAVTPSAALAFPGAPTIGAVTAGSESVAVNWAAPAQTGSSAITGYTVTVYSGTSTTVVTEVAADATATSVSVPGLTNGTAYTFTVAAKNDSGTGPESERSSSVTPAALPGAPTLSTVTPGDGQVAVVWEAPADTGGSPISSYTVQVFEGDSTAPKDTITTDGSTLTATISGLINGTAYRVTVAAGNGVGVGPASTASDPVTPKAPPALPGAPTLGAVTAANGTATVNWTAPAQTGTSAITGYTVTVYAGSTDTVVKTAEVAAGAKSATVSGLTNGTAYTFRVAAKNDGGVGAASLRSEVVTPAAQAPGAPTLGKVTAGDASVSVTWTAPADNGGSAVTGYTVKVFEGVIARLIDTVTVDAATLAATVTGLINGTAYTVTVAAVTQAGTGPESTRSAAVTPVNVPGAPTIGTAVAGADSATVAWTAPSDTGGSPLTGYVVSILDGSSPTRTVEAPAGAASVEVTGLTNGTAYTFTVAAINSVGTGPTSAASNAVTPDAALALPGAPTIGAVTAGSGTATVNWTAPAQTGTSAITGYTVTVYSGSTDTVVQTAEVAAGAKNVTISGLVNGTAYTFTVAAKNATGDGPASKRSASATPVGVPGAPTIGTAVAGAGSATVSWTAPASTGGSNLTGYQVSIFTGTSSTAARTVQAAASASSILVTGLTNGTAYTFTIAAINGVGTGLPSARSNAVTPNAALALPGAPAIGAVTPGNRTATVNWTAPAQTGTSAISGYTVTVYSGTGSRVVRTVAAGAAARSLAITGLTNGTVYTFTVTARNASGAGAASQRSVPVTPAGVPGVPRTLRVVAGNGSATVSWTAPASSGGSPVTGYVVVAYAGTAQVQSVSVPATPTTATISGLANGTAYRFTVAAVTTAGTGPATWRSTAVTPRVQPGAPAIGPATPGNRSAVVSWTAPAQAGASAITGYRVTVYTGTGTAPTKTVTAGRTATRVTVYGLTNGAAYSFTVAAVTSTGIGAASDRSNTVTPAAPVRKPAAPVMRTATAGDASATVTWRAPWQTGGAPVTSYVVTVYPDRSGTVLKSVTVNAASLQATVPGLVTGTRYTFRVAAVNSAGSSALSGRSRTVTPSAAAGLIGQLVVPVRGSVHPAALTRHHH